MPDRVLNYSVDYFPLAAENDAPSDRRICHLAFADRKALKRPTTPNREENREFAAQAKGQSNPVFGAELQGPRRQRQLCVDQTPQQTGTTRLVRDSIERGGLMSKFPKSTDCHGINYTSELVPGINRCKLQWIFVAKTCTLPIRLE
jgi:hypothetical protein